MKDVYAAIMRAKAAQYGRPRYGDKTPMHWSNLDRIFEDFPDARIIHIVRDPRGTALSLAQMPWACKSLYSNASFCEREFTHVKKFESRICRVRLEDLLEDPRCTMGRVLEYVGEPWDDAVLDHATHAPKGDMPPVAWFERSAGPRRPAERKWKLTPAQLRMIERAAPETMNGGGYPPAEIAEEPSGLRVFWERFRDLPEIVRHSTVLLRLYIRLHAPGFSDTDEFDALFGRINPGAWARYPELGGRLPRPPALLAAPRETAALIES